jgi:hypothetical protein
MEWCQQFSTRKKGNLMNPEWDFSKFSSSPSKWNLLYHRVPLPNALIVLTRSTVDYKMTLCVDIIKNIRIANIHLLIGITNFPSSAHNVIMFDDVHFMDVVGVGERKIHSINYYPQAISLPLNRTLIGLIN